MRNSIIYFTWIILTLQSATAQTDSLKQLPLDSIISWLGKQEATNNFTFLKIANYTLHQALKKQEYKLAAHIHGEISYWNYLNYEINGVDSIIYHRKKQIEYSKRIGDQMNVGKGQLDLAIDFMNDNQLKKAQEQLFKAIEIFESLNSETILAEAQANMAYLCVDMKKPKEALYFSALSLPILTKEKDYFMIADILCNGFYRAYMELEDFPKALEYINEAIKICDVHKEFEQRQESLIEFYNYKGKVLLAQNDFTLADSFYRKAWQLEKKYQSKASAERHRFGIGNTFYKQGKYKEALPHLIAGTNAALNLSYFEPRFYTRLSECYEKLGQNKAALSYRIKAFTLKEKIINDKITNLESEALIKYETGKKDQELFEQKTIIAQKTWIQWLSSSIAVLLTILLSTLFYYFKKNQKTSQLLSEKNKQNELLLKEIHHRVKNNLQVISSLLNFQSRSIKDKGVKMALLDSQSRVRSMSLIHQKLYRGEQLAAVEMKSYLSNLAESLIDAYADEEDVEVNIEMDTLELDVDYAIPLGLIANELVTNTLKYAFPNERKGAIKIHLHQQENDLILSIADNGIGKNANTVKKESDGFGSELIQMLSLQLKGTLKQSTNNGFQTQFRFPYAQVA